MDNLVSVIDLQSEDCYPHSILYRQRQPRYPINCHTAFRDSDPELKGAYLDPIFKDKVVEYAVKLHNTDGSFAVKKDVSNSDNDIQFLNVVKASNLPKKAGEQKNPLDVFIKQTKTNKGKIVSNLYALRDFRRGEPVCLVGGTLKKQNLQEVFIKSRNPSQDFLTVVMPMDQLSPYFVWKHSGELITGHKNPEMPSVVEVFKLDEDTGELSEFCMATFLKYGRNSSNGNVTLRLVKDLGAKKTDLSIYLVLVTTAALKEGEILLLPPLNKDEVLGSKQDPILSKTRLFPSAVGSQVPLVYKEPPRKRSRRVNQPVDPNASAIVNRTRSKAKQTATQHPVSSAPESAKRKRGNLEEPETGNAIRQEDDIKSEPGSFDSGASDMTLPLGRDVRYSPKAASVSPQTVALPVKHSPGSARTSPVPPESASSPSAEPRASTPSSNRSNSTHTEPFPSPRPRSTRSSPKTPTSQINSPTSSPGSNSSHGKTSGNWQYTSPYRVQVPGTESPMASTPVDSPRRQYPSRFSPSSGIIPLSYVPLPVVGGSNFAYPPVSAHESDYSDDARATSKTIKDSAKRKEFIADSKKARRQARARTKYILDNEEALVAKVAANLEPGHAHDTESPPARGLPVRSPFRIRGIEENVPFGRGLCQRLLQGPSDPSCRRLSPTLNPNWLFEEEAQTIIFVDSSPSEIDFTQRYERLSWQLFEIEQALRNRAMMISPRFGIVGTRQVVKFDRVGLLWVDVDMNLSKEEMKELDCFTRLPQRLQNLALFNHEHEWLRRNNPNWPTTLDRQDVAEDDVYWLETYLRIFQKCCTVITLRNPTKSSINATLRGIRDKTNRRMIEGLTHGVALCMIAFPSVYIRKAVVFARPLNQVEASFTDFHGLLHDACGPMQGSVQNIFPFVTWCGNDGMELPGKIGRRKCNLVKLFQSQPGAIGGVKKYLQGISMFVDEAEREQTAKTSFLNSHLNLVTISVRHNFNSRLRTPISKDVGDQTLKPCFIFHGEPNSVIVPFDKQLAVFGDGVVREFKAVGLHMIAMYQQRFRVHIGDLGAEVKRLFNGFLVKETEKDLQVIDIDHYHKAVDKLISMANEMEATAVFVAISTPHGDESEFMMGRRRFIGNYSSLFHLIREGATSVSSVIFWANHGQGLHLCRPVHTRNTLKKRSITTAETKMAIIDLVPPGCFIGEFSLAPSYMCPFRPIAEQLLQMDPMLAPSNSGLAADTAVQMMELFHNAMRGSKLRDQSFRLVDIHRNGHEHPLATNMYRTSPTCINGLDFLAMESETPPPSPCHPVSPRSDIAPASTHATSGGSPTTTEVIRTRSSFSPRSSLGSSGTEEIDRPKTKTTRTPMSKSTGAQQCPTDRRSFWSIARFDQSVTKVRRLMDGIQFVHSVVKEGRNERDELDVLIPPDLKMELLLMTSLANPDMNVLPQGKGSLPFHVLANSLIPVQWLDDAVMDAYCNLIADTNNTPDATRKVAMFSPHDTCREVANLGQEYIQNVALKHLNIMREEGSIAVFPIHEPDHWTLIVYDSSKRSMLYYDSIRRSSMCTWAVNNVKKILMLIYEMLKDEDPRRSVPDLKRKRATKGKMVDYQSGASDCGVFAAQTIEQIVRGMQPHAYQKNMDDYRYMMISELVTYSLVPRRYPTRD